jgi:hypothetical protein
MDGESAQSNYKLVQSTEHIDDPSNVCTRVERANTSIVRFKTVLSVRTPTCFPSVCSQVKKVK